MQMWHFFFFIPHFFSFPPKKNKKIAFRLRKFKKMLNFAAQKCLGS